VQEAASGTFEARWSWWLWFAAKEPSSATADCSLNKLGRAPATGTPAPYDTSEKGYVVVTGARADDPIHPWLAMRTLANGSPGVQRHKTKSRMRGISAQTPCQLATFDWHHSSSCRSMAGSDWCHMAGDWQWC
jgi:hypothetical protein